MKVYDSYDNRYGAMLQLIYYRIENSKLISPNDTYAFNEP
ncbi:hypothetical protein SPV2_gp27 [Sulfolobus polyhedral virus 2]|uniref:Uncharacterized protein n=1 Tax=Sulfolobus polyhedral virus 2 TaxID=2493125 RepID=A0A3S8NFI1_9VIRU|nr:hypothetical protein KM458_gp27 [Sulfolobus polyhedral virus 2]AZI76026.1 hypothetical protein SPV2_gp27 [Sulfolobus polyhedral virus 2]